MRAWRSTIAHRAAARSSPARMKARCACSSRCTPREALPASHRASRSSFIRRAASPAAMRSPIDVHVSARCAGADHHPGRRQVVQGQRPQRHAGHRAARRRRPRMAAAGSDRVRCRRRRLDARRARHREGAAARLGHRRARPHRGRRVVRERLLPPDDLASPRTRHAVRTCTGSSARGSTVATRCCIRRSAWAARRSSAACGPGVRHGREAALEALRAQLGNDAAPLTVLAPQLLVARTRGATTQQVRTTLEAAWRALRPQVLGCAALTPRIWAT